MSPRVTVVMPVYNGERFIAEAVQSVLDSTFRDFELIVIDDGSADRSVMAAQEASAGDARVRVMTLEHGGVAVARNFGLAEAQGEFIANLDSDDAMFPDRLARQVAFLDAHADHVAVGSRALLVNSKGHPIGLGVHVFTHEEIDGAHMEGRGGGVWNPTAMFRREAALRAGAYRTSLTSAGEDYDLWLRLAEIGRIANTRDVFVRYRVHDANVSLSHKERREAVRLESLRRAFERRGITDREPVLIRAPAPSFGERWRNEALLAYYRGNRRGALLRALVAAVHVSSLPTTGQTISTILQSTAPTWRSYSAVAPQ